MPTTTASVVLIGRNATRLGAIAAILEYKHQVKIVDIVDSCATAADRASSAEVDAVLWELGDSREEPSDAMQLLCATWPRALIVLSSEQCGDFLLTDLPPTNGRIVIGEAPEAIAQSILRVIRERTRTPDVQQPESGSRTP